jgi:hypothetical protein
MFDTIGRIVLIIIGIAILIALAEEYIKKPDTRIIYHILGGIIVFGLIVSKCSCG